jgi:membrane protein CcdC involved in cytochrome C biogenesis
MIRIIMTAILLSVASAASVQPLKMDDEGNILVPIFYSSGAVMCCCPAERLTSGGPEWTDIYCAIPIGEYNRWMIELHEAKELDQKGRGR